MGGEAKGRELGKEASARDNINECGLKVWRGRWNGLKGSCRSKLIERREDGGKVREKGVGRGGDGGRGGCTRSFSMASLRELIWLLSWEPSLVRMEAAMTERDTPQARPRAWRDGTKT